MAIRNPLQEQLLKAGLVKKGKVDQIAREQARARHGKGAPATAETDRIDAARLQAERAERDRALAAERNAQARLREQQAQVRQIVETQRVKRSGELEYRFEDGSAIRTLLVDKLQRAQLASGALVIVRHDDGVELVPRAAAEKIRERDAGAILVDHGSVPAAAGSGDDYYDQERFKVPDDLVW
ncbi:MAG: DUF2058 domain-containing protein [Pseudomonas sp.]